MRIAAVILLGLALALAAAPAAAQGMAKVEGEAKRAFDSGRFKEAGDKYAAAAAAVGLTPDRKSDLHLQSAWSYYIAGISRSAREQLKEAFSSRPDLQVIPDFYSPDFANLAAAVRTETAGANLPAIDIEELKRSARAKLADGKIEEALYDLKRAPESADPELFRILAEANDRAGRTADADAARRHAADLEKGLVSTAPIGAPLDAIGAPPAAPPVSIGHLLEEAEKAFAAGDFLAAGALALQAAEADPKSAEAHRIAADAALAAGMDADAEREYTAAMLLEPSNARAQYGMGVVAERQKKWNTAASHFGRALELNPRNAGAARGLGRALNELGEKSAARIAFGRAIEIDPGSAEPHNDFGVFLFRADEIGRAQEELMEAVRLDPGRPLYHENLGRVLRKKGMWKEAERELAEAVRLAGNAAAAWIALGQVRVEQHKLDEAAAAYSTAVALDPLSEDAVTALGATLAAAGRLADAEAALAKATEANAKSPVLWNNLGVVRTRMANHAAAFDAFQRALALDATFDAARSNLARASELAALEKATF